MAASDALKDKNTGLGCHSVIRPTQNQPNPPKTIRRAALTYSSTTTCGTPAVRAIWLLCNVGAMRVRQGLDLR